jgi:hypothetical protein
MEVILQLVLSPKHTLSGWVLDTSSAGTGIGCVVMGLSTFPSSPKIFYFLVLIIEPRVCMPRMFSTTELPLNSYPIPLTSEPWLVQCQEGNRGS